MHKRLFFFAICFILVTACGGTGGDSVSRDAGGSADDAGLNGDGGGCAPAPDAGGPAAAAATMSFMESCRQHAECKSGLCFNFNGRSARCTTPCNSACQCNAPSTGCSNMGVCKAP